MKKAWTTPHLLVLVRGRPEEAILVVCKGTAAGIATPAEPAFLYQYCQKALGTGLAGGGGCTSCSDLSKS